MHKPPIEAEHNCICAFADMPILDFYSGYFDSVYIFLHPFYKVNEKLETTRIVSWNEMLSLTGFTHINQLDIALRNNIGGLVNKWKNDEDVEILKSVCEKFEILLPSEGLFQETLERQMLLSLKQRGHHYMFIADEFGYERKLADIQDYIDGKDNTALQWGPQRNWYTNKHEILYTVHWDSHFTMLCSEKATIESILKEQPFEGFYCNEETEIYWSCASR
ncbi:DUF2711 family protein [Mucilaginibacter pocheonensis]|uniref:DUF2711 domain-containing protein n=1 Tax=Mucilaginibacter pocheonensis TaxID=398050 RepID=A0ABU1TAR3_9SPHI|nr:DUF2711 family protein [Mucilaginibacter pocheonensis]MDR6942489.1 hypothetical protein [Mucilaginibacter pocheonensis]